MVGLAMAVVAFVLERIVMRSVRPKGTREQPSDVSTVRGRGAELEG